MWDNTLRLTLDEGKIEIIITNKESGNSHLVSGKNWTEAANAAIKDTKQLSGNGTFNF